MPRTPLIAFTVVVAVLVASCGGSGEAKTCDDIADQTVEQMQKLVDAVDDEFGAMTLDEFFATDGEPSNLAELSKESDAIEKRWEELGCTDEEVAARISTQIGGLTADTDIGRLFLDLVVTSGT
jgi:hypothetical protein